MNLILHKLEEQIPENLLEKGENLLESGQIHGMQEVEKHLWTAVINGFEVEVQISPSKVKGFSCECRNFSHKKGCEHTTALLLLVRSKRMEQKAEKDKKDKAPKAIQKLTVNSILDYVETDDLVEFIREYARDNRAFSLALKARFASTVPVANKRDNYTQLLESAVNAARNKKDQFNARGLQKVLIVLRELIAQVDDALEQEHFAEAAYILISLMEKTGPIARKVSGNAQKLFHLLQEAFERFFLLINPDTAQELRDTIWQFALTESGKSVYRGTPLVQGFHQLLVLLADDAGKREELLQHFRGQIELPGPAEDDSYKSNLLILMLNLLEKSGNKEAAQEHLVEHLNDSTFLLYAVDQALREGDAKKARILAEQGFPSLTDKIQKSNLEELLLQVAILEKDAKAICLYAKNRFLASKERTYLQLLRDHITTDWDDLAAEILEELKAQPYSFQKRDAIAFLLALQQQWTELLTYIRQLQSFDLLQEYAQSLEKAAPEELALAYEELMRQYLKSHLGRKPSQKVREVLEYLHTAGLEHIVDRIMQLLRLEFPERQSLMSELEELFT